MNINFFFRKALKTGFGRLMGGFSSWLLKDKVTIFNYHEISQQPSEFTNQFNLNVTPDVFDFQIDFIKKKFNVISPDDLINNKIPLNAALITFDDGFSGVYSNAIPILQKHQVPAIIFLNMKVLKGDLFWACIITYLCKYDHFFMKYLRKVTSVDEQVKPAFLSCSNAIVKDYCELYNVKIDSQVRKYVGEFISLRELKEADLAKGIYFGNHLDNHYAAINMSDDELLISYYSNEAELEEYNSYIKLFAFPFGQQNTCFNISQVDLMIKAGAAKVFSTHSTLNFGNGSYYMHRIPLYQEDSSPSMMWSRIFYRSVSKLFLIINHLSNLKRVDIE